MSKVFSTLFLHSVLATLLIFSVSAHANPTFWEFDDSIDLVNAERFQGDVTTLRLYEFQLLEFLKTAQDGVTISLPLPDGSFSQFSLNKEETLPSTLAEKYPDILSFKGQSTNNPQATARINTSADKHSFKFKNDNKIFFIEQQQTNEYVLYRESSLVKAAPRKPDTVNFSSRLASAMAQRPAQAARTINSSKKILRLAVSATGEYTAYHGGSVASALAEINTMVNRINDVFERDLGVTFELVANNDQLIFTNSATDPFSNSINLDIDVNKSVIDQRIGSINYDIGHVLMTDGGGLATLSGVCNLTYKAQGVSGLPDPTGEYFYISLVAHEIGHQLGANHTFNGTSGACGDNRNAETAWEPGSGSSIMSYAGICDQENLQNDSDPMFHIGSIEQMRDTVYGNSSCGRTLARDNTAPTANAGADFTIPADTPFKLSGQANDINNDQLLSVWEQQDIGSASFSRASLGDDGSRPIFRSLNPSSSTERYFPLLSDVVANTSSIGESLPSTDRTMNFRFTVRDGSAVASDTTEITVDNNSGPFAVTEPSPSAIWQDTSEVVRWNIANTHLPPVSCSNVDILMSTDNGVTFTEVLVENTPNDGIQGVSGFPRTSSPRIMVRCSNNIFFAVNSGAFEITTEPENRTDTNSTSSSSGGGAMHPLYLIVLLCFALSACARNDKPSSLPDAPLPPHHDKDEEGNAKSKSLPSVEEALKSNDLRLWMTSSRAPSAPGIDPAKANALIARCGKKYLPNSGDVLTSDTQLSKRQSLIEYATQYNQKVAEHCQ